MKAICVRQADLVNNNAGAATYRIIENYWIKAI